MTVETTDEERRQLRRVRHSDRRRPPPRETAHGHRITLVRGVHLRGRALNQPLDSQHFAPAWQIRRRRAESPAIAERGGYTANLSRRRRVRITIRQAQSAEGKGGYWQVRGEGGTCKVHHAWATQNAGVLGKKARRRPAVESFVLADQKNLGMASRAWGITAHADRAGRVALTFDAFEVTVP